MNKEIIDIISSSTALIIAGVTIVVAILTYLRRGRLKFGKISLEFDQEIDKEIDQIKGRLKEKLPESTPEDRQYLLLREYHIQGLAQSKISFWFSLIFASIGFAVIVIAILTMDKEVKFTEQGSTFVTLIAGTIIDAVSALFFVQSNKARKLMSEFFDKLRTDRIFEESLQQTSQITDPILKNRLKMVLALNFAKVNLTDTVLNNILIDSDIEKEENK